MNLWPWRRRPQPKIAIIGPEGLDSPAFLAAWDQANTSVRNTYDELITAAIELDAECGCGAVIDSPRHTIALSTVLLGSFDQMTLAKLLTEAVLRDALTRTNGR